jgi:hypothetical protein
MQISNIGFVWLRNAVVAIVVGSISLGVIARLWPPANIAAQFLREQFIALIKSLGVLYLLPGWFIAVMGVLSTITLVRYAQSMRPPAPTLPHPYTNYTKDNIFGATWRWLWDSGKAIKITGYCPNCDLELVYDDSSAQDPLRRLEPKTEFICDRCDHTVMASVRGRKHYAIGVIRREIYRRVRLGLYLQEPQ